ncbi:MAG: glycosyltransferase 61 family protein [Rhodospirillales bacterium]|nr:glycosyltransferase 61 family protein [Rhodospirillales bacterium]
MTEPRGALQAIQDLRRAGRLAEAVATCRAAIHAQPGNPLWQGLMAEMALESGQDTAALELVRRHLALADDAATRRTLAEMLEQAAGQRATQAKWRESAVLSRRAAELAPDWEKAWLRLGDSLVHSDDRTAAWPAYARGGMLAATARPLVGAAQLCLIAGKTDTAETLARHALVLAPDWALACKELAAALLGRQRTEAALAWSRRGLALTPGNKALTALHGTALRLSGAPEAALASFGRILSAISEDCYVWHQFGKALHQLGRFDQAERALRAAMVLDPSEADHAEAHRWLLHHVGRTAEASRRSWHVRLLLGQSEAGSNWRPARLTSLAETAPPLQRLTRPLRVRITNHGLRTIEPCLYELSDVHAIPPDWSFLTADGRLIADDVSVGPSLIRAGRYDHIAPRGGDACRVRLDDPLHYPGRHAFIGLGANYYHLLADHLPRLIALMDSDQYDRVQSIVIEEPEDPIVWQMLDLLKVPRHRITVLPRNRAAHFERLLLLSHFEIYGHLHDVTFRILRGRFLPKNPPKPWRRLYISRADAPRRKVRNEAALLEALTARGFEVILPARSPFSEQVRLFHEAAVVVGPHGSALTNVLWCQPGTVIRELLGFCDHQIHFEAISARLGFDYRALRATHAATEYPGDQHSDFTVNIEDLLAGLPVQSGFRDMPAGRQPSAVDGGGAAEP